MYYYEQGSLIIESKLFSIGTSIPLDVAACFHADHQTILKNMICCPFQQA